MSTVAAGQTDTVRQEREPLETSDARRLSKKIREEGIAVSDTCYSMFTLFVNLFPGGTERMEGWKDGVWVKVSVRQS